MSSGGGSGGPSTFPPNLVPCVDCGRPLSRLARACPGCGRALAALASGPGPGSVSVPVWSGGRRRQSAADVVFRTVYPRRERRLRVLGVGLAVALAVLFLPAVLVWSVVFRTASRAIRGENAGVARPAGLGPGGGGPRAVASVLPAGRPSILVRYRFHRADEPRNFDQARVIVSPGRHSLGDYLDLAVSIRERERSAKAHVLFFDDPSCLENPEGAGLLADSDWPHWRMEVGTVAGRTPTHKVAVDGLTGEPRTDVLAP